MTANYAITGIWCKENKKGSEHISHVMLHEVSNGQVKKGSKASKDDVVALLRIRTVSTLKWNYKDGAWNWGAKVTTEVRGGVNYLRTIPDGDVSNNLDNLIDMQIL